MQKHIREKLVDLKIVGKKEVEPKSGNQINLCQLLQDEYNDIADEQPLGYGRKIIH
jgi:hypothetical protein